MALQVNLGTVEVTNGSPTVRHEWKLLMGSGAPSTFSVGQAVTWVFGGGTGTVGAWDSVSRTLLIARLTGGNPAVGTVIVGPTGSATVSSIAPGSPPNWNAKVTLPAVATFERHYGDYNVSAVAADSFTLSTNYLGATARDVEYGLNTDFTSLGLGIIRAGDVGATAIVSRSMTRLNTLLTRGAAAVRLSANLGPLTNGWDAAISWTVEDEDTGGFVTVPSTNFIVPAGIRRVDVGCALKLTAALSVSTHVVNVRLLKNANEIAQHSIIPNGIGANLFRGALLVVAGDTLSIKVSATAPTGTLPSILSGQETNFWVRVAEVI